MCIFGPDTVDVGMIFSFTPSISTLNSSVFDFTDSTDADIFPTPTFKSEILVSCVFIVLLIVPICSSKLLIAALCASIVVYFCDTFKFISSFAFVILESVLLSNSSKLESISPIV